MKLLKWLCFVALENVYYAFHLFFFISSEWAQWLLCITLEQLKDMNLFLAPSFEKAQAKMAGSLRAACTPCWRVSVICWGLENNIVNKGTKQVWFNEMFLTGRRILLFPLFLVTRLKCTDKARGTLTNPLQSLQHLPQAHNLYFKAK